MIYKFSESAKKALESAEKLAKDLGNSYVGTEHLLYGLASEEGLANKVLKKKKIDKNLILNKIYSISNKNSNNVNRIQGFTQKTKKIIEYAYVQCEKIYLRSIGTEQLLLAILNGK